MGTLLHCGDYFTLNVLAAGRSNEQMKQFLQPFPPGANRFAGLQVDESPQGQPILPQALAWLEGYVKDRMECGDHWLIYAEIHNGKVLDSKVLQQYTIDVLEPTIKQHLFYQLHAFLRKPQ